FRDYITDYIHQAKNDQITQLSTVLGLDENRLRALMAADLTEANLNEYGRFDDLKNTVDKAKAKEYFESVDAKKIPTFKVNIRVHNLLQRFVLEGGFDVERAYDTEEREWKMAGDPGKSDED